MKNIVLVGFMGTGKTEIARGLARDLEKKYVSVDALIESVEKRKIKDIFSSDGEPYFRRAEKRVIKELSEKTDLIIDTGGGAVLDSENMVSLKKNGIIVCLWASPDVIYRRTKSHGHRPLLNVEDPEKRIKEMLEYRRPFYEKADAHIDTSGLTKKEVRERIKEIIGEYGREN
ncbi:MAG: shikimate kinase [Candidatus Omnitrophota bacterium]